MSDKSLTNSSEESFGNQLLLPFSSRRTVTNITTQSIPDLIPDYTLCPVVKTDVSSTMPKTTISDDFGKITFGFKLDYYTGEIKVG